MAKKEETTEVQADERQKQWEAFLEAFKVSNPVKYEQRKKAGELNKIPDSFR